MAHDSFRLPCPSGCLSSEDSCIEFDVPDSHFEDPDAGDEIVSIGFVNREMVGGRNPWWGGDE